MQRLCIRVQEAQNYKNYHVIFTKSSTNCVTSRAFGVGVFPLYEKKLVIPDKGYKVPQLMFIPMLHQIARKERLKSIPEKSGTQKPA